MLPPVFHCGCPLWRWPGLWHGSDQPEIRQIGGKSSAVHGCWQTSYSATRLMMNNPFNTFRVCNKHETTLLFPTCVFLCNVPSGFNYDSITSRKSPAATTRPFVCCVCSWCSSCSMPRLPGTTPPSVYFCAGSGCFLNSNPQYPSNSFADLDMSARQIPCTQVPSC